MRLIRVQVEPPSTVLARKGRTEGPVVTEKPPRYSRPLTNPSPASTNRRASSCRRVSRPVAASFDQLRPPS